MTGIRASLSWTSGIKKESNSKPMRWHNHAYILSRVNRYCCPIVAITKHCVRRVELSNKLQSFLRVYRGQIYYFTYLSSSCRVAHKARTRSRQTPLSWAPLAAVSHVNPAAFSSLCIGFSLLLCPMLTQHPSVLLPLFVARLFSACLFFVSFWRPG